MVLTAALLLSVAPPASAGGLGFHLGAGFKIGSVNFHIAFGGHDHHRRGYYYKTSHHLKYRGARCNDRCFRQSGYYYHDTRCPLLSAHFRHHRVHPGAIFESYSPHYGGYDDGYYGRDRHDRYDRYDRYETRRGRGYTNDDYDDRDYRRHRRYDDRKRYDRRHDRRRHRHDDSCGGWRHRSYDD